MPPSTPDPNIQLAFPDIPMNMTPVEAPPDRSHNEVLKVGRKTHAPCINPTVSRLEGEPDLISQGNFVL